MQTNHASVPMSEKFVLHFIPGDGPNPLIQNIVLEDSPNSIILSLYNTDPQVQEFCSINKIKFHSLDFTSSQLTKQFWTFVGFIRAHNIQFVIAHSFYPSLIAAMSKIFFRKLIVISVRHHNLVHRLSRNIKGIVGDKIISLLSSHVIAVSESVKKTLIDEGCSPNKITVIRNGISAPSRLYAGRKSKSAQSYELIAVGRIDWQKNYEDMFKIVKIIRDQGFDVKLKVLGSGGELYKTSLDRLVQVLDIQQYIEWKGRQRDVFAFMNEADLLIHTAIDEACPLIVIESLMFGIPMVCSNLGGCSDVLQGFQPGYDPRNNSEFAAQIIARLKQLDLYAELSRLNSRKAAKVYDPKTMALNYSSIVKKFL